MSHYLSYWLPRRSKPNRLIFLMLLPRWLVWGLLLPLIVLNGWALLLLLHYFAPILTKVVTATLLAFGLNYPIKLLQRSHIPRTSAVLLVLTLAIALLALLGVTLLPTLVEQANELANRLPIWINSSSQQLKLLQIWAEKHHFPMDVSHWVTQLETWLSAQLQILTSTTLTIVLEAIGGVLNLMLTLILTFYVLLHGQRLWKGIFRWFPLQSGIKIQKIVQQNFHNYYVGQFILVLCMSIAMTTMLVTMRVPFGLLFGLGIGALAFFPFGAAFGIVLVSLLTLMQSFWLGLKVLVIATIIDQLIENGIAPQLMGRFTGLNPVWVLISLLAGAKIAGLLGLVIAVPVSSSIKNWVDREESILISP